jgi:hypothetical protein
MLKSFLKQALVIIVVLAIVNRVPVVGALVNPVPAA